VNALTGIRARIEAIPSAGIGEAIDVRCRDCGTLHGVVVDNRNSLRCVKCRSIRGSLTPQTAKAIEAIVSQFGTPEIPIVLRKKP
jgi:hypothetical protein